jgi:hypothetical protein
VVELPPIVENPRNARMMEGVDVGETDPIPVVPSPDAGNPNVSIKFEDNDLSVGSARYTAAKQISKNLAMKPNGPGLPDSPIAHANVEVHLCDDHGHEVRMTRRLVRYWYIKPMPNAVVSDLSKWQIVGLTDDDITPLPVAPGHPASWNFEWDRPGSKDAPGVQGVSVKDKAFGQLQEFLVGNAEVGGAYYQVYVLEDGSSTRVMTSSAMTLSAKNYRDALRSIDSGGYTKTNARRLFFMPAMPKTDEITSYP